MSLKYNKEFDGEIIINTSIFIQFIIQSLVCIPLLVSSIDSIDSLRDLGAL